MLTGQYTERSPLFCIELRRQHIEAFTHLPGTMTVAKLVGGKWQATRPLLNADQASMKGLLAQPPAKLTSLISAWVTG